MRVGIISLPLHTNYGGILQAFALQRALNALNCECRVVSKDPLLRKSFFLKQYLKYFVRWLKKIIRGTSATVFVEDCYNQSCLRLGTFINQNIDCRIVASLKDLQEQEFDAIVFGSDQIWRPQYAKYGWGSIEDVFASFADKWKSLKIAYAASFGVDSWEYSPEETALCSTLAQKFDAISVREQSGVRLCNEFLGVDADFVLDPTLLLDRSQYEKLCENVPESQDSTLVAYVLNMSEEIRSACEKIAKERSLKMEIFSAEINATLSIPEWLAMFRDASYVVTDSFHGTVFSIIFEKEFECVFNKARGAARFESLLNMYNSGRLEEMREFSLNWLKRTLES